MSVLGTHWIHNVIMSYLAALCQLKRENTSSNFRIFDLLCVRMGAFGDGNKVPGVSLASPLEGLVTGIVS